jgi:hypothetical protein
MVLWIFCATHFGSQLDREGTLLLAFYCLQSSDFIGLHQRHPGVDVAYSNIGSYERCQTWYFFSIHNPAITVQNPFFIGFNFLP